MRRLILWIVILVSVGYALSGITQVRPEEQAVVRRFGEPITRWGPGLHLALPWGLDQVDRVPVTTIRQIQVGYEPGTDYVTGPTPVGQLLTADQNLINLSLAVDYSIQTDDSGLEDFVMAQEQVPGVLARTVEGLAAEWTASRTIDRVLLRGNAELPQWLTNRLSESIRPYRLGIRVQQVSVSYLAPPDEVKASFEEVNRAQSNMLTLENQAQQEAGRRLRSAEAEANRQRQLAEGYRAEELSLAHADAVAFQARLDQYVRLREENSDILASIWWEATGRILAGMRQQGRIDLIDNHLGANGLDITQFLPPRK